MHRDFLISKELFKSVADYINPDLFEEFNKKKFIRFKISNNTILSLEDCISTFFETDNYLSRKNYEKILCCQLIGAIYADLQLSMHNAESFKSFCLTAMSENINNPEALQVICQQLEYSYMYFCKKFKNKFGCTPMAYLNSIRIKNAAYLLLTSNCTLGECYEQIGISSNEKMVLTILNSSARWSMIDLVSQQVEYNLKLHFKEDAKRGNLPKPNPELMAEVFTGALVQSACCWMLNKNRFSKEEVVEQFSNLVMRI